MGFCPKCGEYMFSNCHTCSPYTIEYYDEATVVYGNSFENAVEKFAKEYNEDDPVVDDAIFEESLIVTDENGVSKKFNCYAEPVLEYSVEEIV